MRILLGALIVSLVLFSCKDEKAYDDYTIIKGIQVTVDGEAYTQLAGTTYRPLFIYDNAGNWKANYVSHENFSLDNGTYTFVYVNYTTAFTADRLENALLPQLTTGAYPYYVSAPTQYRVPSDQPLKLEAKTLSGRILISNTSEKPDYRYDRVVMTTKLNRTDYRLNDGSFVEGNMDIVTEVSTSKGGVGVADTLYVFPDNGASVVFDFYNGDNKVRSITSPSFNVESKKTTNVAVGMNDLSGGIDYDFNVTITDEEWKENLVEIPSLKLPFDVPEGYTVVYPSDNLGTLINTMQADAEVAEMKLILYPDPDKQNVFDMGGNKTFSKSLSLIAPSDYGMRPKVTIGSFAIEDKSADLSAVKYLEFENIEIAPASPSKGAYMFNNSSGQKFNMDAITFRGCELSGFGRSIFRVQNKTIGDCTVKTFTFEDCVILKYGSSDNYGLFAMSDGGTFDSVVFKKSTFILGSALKKGIFDGFKGHAGTLNVNIENCTFYNGGVDNVLFNIQTNESATLNMNLKNNLFSGAIPSRYLQTTSGTTINNNYADNYCTKDWGSKDSYQFGTMPADAGLTEAELFVKPAETYPEDCLSTEEIDLTIKDKASDVYTKGIGDPRWIK